MAEERWERLAAATGIAFVVVTAVALFMAPTPPDPGTAPDVVATYYTDNGDKLRLQSYLLGIGGIFFLWFLGTLRAFLGAAEGANNRLSATAFGAGIATFTAIGTGAGIAATLAHKVAEQADPGITSAMHDFASMSFAGASFPTTAFFAAVALVSGRTKALPAWLGWFAWLLVPVSLVAAGAVFLDSGAFAPGGVFGYAGSGLTLLWFLGASVVLLQRVGRDTRVATRG